MPELQKKSNRADNYINYFIHEQQKNGSFSDDKKSESVFFTALTLSYLNSLAKTPEIREAKKKAVEFLLSKKDDRWLFGDNIGVNFLVYSALMEYDPKIIDGAAMAKILMVLTSVETKEGGPYYSDINKQDVGSAKSPPLVVRSHASGPLRHSFSEASRSAADGQFNRVDLGVNAVIAYFLSLQDVDLPELNKLIESAIENNDFESKFFASHCLTVYFISKFYKGGKKERLTDFILKKKSEAKSRLEILLAETALDNLKKKENKMALEAEKDEEEARITELIIKIAEKRFSALDGEIKNIAMQGIKNTIRGNRDKQMSLMSYYMKQALGKKGRGISDDTIARMGLANVFYWTAFIIYDDFLDEDEAADPKMLPAYNIYSRHYTDFFSTLLAKNTGFHSFFHTLMDGLDAACSWEMQYCRTRVEGSVFFIPELLPEYGDYEKKYRPVAGHILGPVAMLYLLGYKEDSPETQNLISYFKNYLIAMQINDDAHDWEEDMRRGHLSTVAVMLLKDYQEKYPGKKEIDMDKELQKLKEVFWFKTIVAASQTSMRHTDKSRQALKSMTVLEYIAPLEKYIIITENVARKALDEQKKTIDFLDAYEH